MKRGRRLWLTAGVAILAAMFWGGCSSIDCPVQNTVSTFYSIRGSDGEATALTDTLWVFTQRSDGTDTLLLNRLTASSSFSLPISYQHPEDILFFFMADTAGNYTLDTLWVKKDDIPHFESVDCSAHFFHRITALRSTHERIDSVVIADKDVDYRTDRTNIKVYFKQ